MPTPHCRVLVIDDDAEWLEVVVEVLGDAGYVVASASDGLEGTAMIEAFEPFVVITDLEMPGMNGRQLLANTHAAEGRLPVIVISGDKAADASGLPGAFRFLAKPSTPEGVLAAVADAAAHRVERLPLMKLWQAAPPHSTRRQPGKRARGADPLSFLADLFAGAVSFVRAIPPRHVVLAAAVLASSLLIRQLSRA